MRHRFLAAAILAIALAILAPSCSRDSNTVGALQVLKNLKYRRDPEYREKIDTELHDERNSFIRMKSWSWAGYITVLLEGIGVVAAMIRGQETIQQVLSYSICLIVATYWISYMVLSRKY